jgi:hypothetical protein
MKGWHICRIDGTTPPLERRDQMDVFQSAGDAPDAPRLFLLSTRSGGLGVNLTAADTVIFYDQDWVRLSVSLTASRSPFLTSHSPILLPLASLASPHYPAFHIPRPLPLPPLFRLFFLLSPFHHRSSHLPPSLAP